MGDNNVCQHGVLRDLCGLAHEEASPSAPRSRTAERESLTDEQREATRLLTVREGDEVKAAALEGLAAMHWAERDSDYQVYMAGLGKLIAAGMAAKTLRDTLFNRYGSDAVSL